jgi:hypothetical protein
MLLLENGLILTQTEHDCIRHLISDPEARLIATIDANAIVKRDALIEEWRPRLYADASVTELPTDADDLATLILAGSDYQTRAQRDAAVSEPISTHNKDSYDAVTRSGSTVTLFASGLTVADLAANCTLAYIQSLEEFAIGALMGQVNRGKKRMIAKYHPIILADDSVSTMPATEDGLITMILARADYVRGG